MAVKAKKKQTKQTQTTSQKVAEVLGEKKMTRADLPDIGELADGGSGAEYKEAIALMEEAFELKTQIGKKGERGKPGEGLLGKLDDMVESLAAIQVESGLPGMRYGRLVFSAQLQEGRENLSMTEFITGLIERGVKPSLIREAKEAATTPGEPFWKRDLLMLKG